MIYLATPYAHDDPAVMQRRFEQVTRYAGELMRLGVLVYSPISHNHPVATTVTLPRTWEFWRDHDLAMLTRCSQLLVLRLDGWQKSTGVRAEMDFAAERGIPIVYADMVYCVALDELVGAVAKDRV